MWRGGIVADGWVWKNGEVPAVLGWGFSIFFICTFWRIYMYRYIFEFVWIFGSYVQLSEFGIQDEYTRSTRK